MSEIKEGRPTAMESPSPERKVEPEAKAKPSTPDTNIIDSEKASREDAIEVADTKPEGEEIVYPNGLVLAAIVLALCLAVFLVALDQTIIATAIPRITDRFQSVKDIGWYGAVRP